MSDSDQKSDYLRECMTDPALVSGAMPIDQFSQVYCVVCSYKPCVRSRANHMLFTERVANWLPRMFTQVPRAADDDERYARIRAKNFQSVEAPLTVNTRPLHVPEFVSIQDKPSEAPVHSIPITSTEPPAPAPALSPVETLEAPVMTQPVIAPQLVVTPQQTEPTLNNTPFQGGIILKGKPVDNKEDKVLDPSGTFTFGDD